MRAQRMGAVLAVGVALAALAPMSANAATTKHSAYTVTVTSDKKTDKAGKELKLTGKVTPKVKGEKVVAWTLDGKTWKSIASSHTRKDGAYTIRVKPSVTGKREFKVEAVASKSHSAGYSKIVDVTVKR